ncbi:pancreatic lipase-related protein 2-like [Littorina saxatilis]|uniref:Lipase domain-containing protein n=1 Tax=Littorina saxatilis TaxID=31220 RepID=A0AAN9AQ33_9CAEN
MIIHSSLCFLALSALTCAVFTVSGEHSLFRRDQKCIASLGCFHTSPQVKELPLDPEQIGTQFLLFSRAGRQTPVVFNATTADSVWKAKVHEAHFDGHKDTKFITHGYMDSGHTDWIVKMKDEFLKKGDFNIIVVSWPGGARQLLNKAVANVFVVAAEVSKLITYLQTNNGLNLGKVHLIGHSLGAQISGNVGTKLHSAVGRISGLDPAEPFFKDMANTMRLNKDDAKFVDIIHSDGEPFNGVQGYGLITALGHVDFYPNGGYDQPGCSDSFFQGLAGIFGGHAGSDASLACSHGRSHQFFIESINENSCKFHAHPCASWDEYRKGTCKSCPSGGCPIMGYEASTSARGSFYLATTMTSPFCGYEYFVEIDLTDHVDEDSFGRFYITLVGDHSSHETEFSRDDIHYHQRNTETQMIAVHSRVGKVSGVKVKFHHKTGLGTSGDKTVVIHRVLVRDMATGDLAKFCTGDAQLTTDQSKTFNSHTGC